MAKRKSARRRPRSNAGKVISLAAFRKKGKVEEVDEGEPEEVDEGEPEGTSEPPWSRSTHREKRARGELWWQGGRPGGPKTPEEVEERMAAMMAAVEVKRRVVRLLKITQGLSSPSTVKKNIEIVKEYDDDLLRRMAFESTEKQWMEKPSFYRAVMRVAAERWAIFRNPKKKKREKRARSKTDAKVILRRAMKGT
jgi:hypothetical protein